MTDNEKPVLTGGKQGSAATQFKPGQSGNPAGRAKGSTLVTKIRNKIEQAIDSLDQSGKPLETLIEQGFADHPVQMMQAISRFMPKDVNLAGVDGEPLAIRWLRPGEGKTDNDQ